MVSVGGGTTTPAAFTARGGNMAVPCESGGGSWPPPPDSPGMSPPKPGVNPLVSKASQLEDPWNNTYQYKQPGSRNPSSFDLWTTTPDGKVIGNWDGN